MNAGRETAAGAARQLAENWRLVLQLTWADLVAPYRRTVFAGIWAILQPLLPIIAYVFLRILLTNPDAAPTPHPAVFTAIGVVVWFWLADLLLTPFNASQRHRRLAAASSLPFPAIIATGACRALIDLAIRTVFILPIVMIYDTVSPAGALAAFVFLAAAGVVALAVGVILLPVFLVLPDIAQAFSILLRYLIFFSLAVFPLSPDVTAFMIAVNPFARVIDLARETVLGAGLPPTATLTAALLAAALLYLAFLVLGRLGETLKEAAA